MLTIKSAQQCGIRLRACRRRKSKGLEIIVGRVRRRFCLNCGIMMLNDRGNGAVFCRKCIKIKNTARNYDKEVWYRKIR